MEMWRLGVDLIGSGTTIREGIKLPPNTISAKKNSDCQLKLINEKPK